MAARRRRPEDARLSEAFRIAYESAGVSQKEIADALPGIDQPAVSKWARGERPPPLWALPTIDKLCGQPRGYVLRLAEYVSDEINVESAIASDPYITDEGRSFVARAYRFCRREAEAEVLAEMPEPQREAWPKLSASQQREVIEWRLSLRREPPPGSEQAAS